MPTQLAYPRFRLSVRGGCRRRSLIINSAWVWGGMPSQLTNHQFRLGVRGMRWPFTNQIVRMGVRGGALTVLQP